MSSAQLSALISLQQNNYVALVALTAVAYDYVLTFPDEIEYVWNKPWSLVSTLFIGIRYFGILNLITCCLLGSGFLPGPAKTCVFFITSRSRLLTKLSTDVLYLAIIYTIDTWVFNLFLGSANCVMMLRVWAMYNRSMSILAFLLALFSLEIIFSIIGAAISSNPKYVSTSSVKIMDDSFCSVISTPVWLDGATIAILQITHGATMCLFAIVRFVREALQMYNVTKQWQPSHYLSLLATEGILYFFAIFLYDFMNMLYDLGKFPTGGWQMILLIILNYIPVFTLTPRFILNIRKLYARDAWGRSGEGIDTGFGISAFHPDARETAIVFADFGRSGGLEENVEETETAETV